MLPDRNSSSSADSGRWVEIFRFFLATINCWRKPGIILMNEWIWFWAICGYKVTHDLMNWDKCNLKIAIKMVVSIENWNLVRLCLSWQGLLVTDMWFSSPKYGMLLAEMKWNILVFRRKNVHYVRLKTQHFSGLFLSPSSPFWLSIHLSFSCAI